MHGHTFMKLKDYCT